MAHSSLFHRQLEGRTEIIEPRQTMRNVVLVALPAPRSLKSGERDVRMLYVMIQVDSYGISSLILAPVPEG